jgi:predicted Fe-S protein YdhL (DUF1289 family)
MLLWNKASKEEKQEMLNSAKKRKMEHAKK